MSILERYRTWYEHERDCNDKMLGMIESLPAGDRGDQRFGRAVDLAAHLAACRENWLDRMHASGEDQTAWWVEHVALETLRPRFTKIENRWTTYLHELIEEDLSREFEFSGSDG